MQKTSKEQVDKIKCYDSKLMLIRPYLLNFCKSRIYNKQDAEDVCQKSIYILIRKKKEYKKEKSFWSWAWRIASFQIMGYFTVKKRNREDSAEDSLLHSLQVTEYYAYPFSELLKKELKEEREEQFKILKTKLSPMEKTFFELSFEGNSRDLIREHLDVSENAYSRLKNRLITKMKKHLDQNKIKTYKTIE